MNSMANSRSESWPTGEASSPESTGWGQVVSAEFFAARPLPRPNSIALDDLVAETERDAARAAALAEARKEVGAALFGGQPAGLAALRMRSGLSQATLAARVGSSQAHIARIESGKNDPGTQLIARISAVLQMEEVDVFRAIRVDHARREVRQ